MGYGPDAGPTLEETLPPIFYEQKTSEEAADDLGEVEERCHQH